MTGGVRVHALIPAAGRGDRMGGDIPKQYLDLAGKPVLAHAVDALAAHPTVAGVTVALAPDDHRFERLRFDTSVVPERVTGGASRAQSVLNGLAQIASRHDPDWVLIHDAVRPCLPASSLHRLLEEGLACRDGAILAIPVADTLKRQDPERRIAATVDRGGLWSAQTPQLFPLRALMVALEGALAAGATPTDEAAAMEYAGARPLLVQGSAANIKITWPRDLEIAEALLGSGGMAE